MNQPSAQSQPVRSPAAIDPLPSWQAGDRKQAILDFVQAVTAATSPDYIPPGDRIATFDNDGTLWCEQPYPQAMFILGKVQAQVAQQPELADRPIVQALLAQDQAYLAQSDTMAELIQLLVSVSAGMSQSEFDHQASAFLATATHP